MKTSNINPRLNIWANILLSIGVTILLLFVYLTYLRYNPQKLSFEVSALENHVIYDSPLNAIGIQIESLDLSLGITPAEIKNNRWEASTTGISHLKSSVVPGQTGNSILYGHNWPNLLGKLNKAKPGDKITIIYNDNSKKDFEVEYIKEVTPSETSILENSIDKRITLYTCSGFLDSKRLVVVAKLRTNELTN